MFLRPRRDQAGSMGPSVSCLTRPPRLTKTRAHSEEISGLNHTASDLAVYASQWKLPATTQDSLPAAGPALPDEIRTRRVPSERFQACDYPPFPSFSWRDVRSYFGHHRNIRRLRGVR